MQPVFPVFLKLTSIIFAFLIGINFILGISILKQIPYLATLSFAIGGLFSLIQFSLNKTVPNIDLFENEQVLEKQLCVHGKEFKDAGGWLYLTSSNIRFKSHFLSSKKRELIIPLTTITEARVEGRKKLILNVDGSLEEILKLNDAQKWKNKINNAIGNA